MKVLLLGSGGREHALAWKIAQSPKIEKLYIAPGNAGTSAVGENVAIKATDFPALKAFALEHKIDMIVPKTRWYRVFSTSSKKMPLHSTLLSSVLLQKVHNWKAAKNLPRNSCCAITSLPPAIKA